MGGTYERPPLERFFREPVPDNRANQEPATSLDACCMAVPTRGLRCQTTERPEATTTTTGSGQISAVGGTADNPRAGGEWLETQAALLLLVLAAAAYLRGSARRLT